VPVVPFRLAVNRVQAQSAANELGGPVVLKIASPDIAHKSDIGGVALNVSGREAVGEAYDRIEAAAKVARPDARLDGIVVSPMRAKGVEFFVGIARDPQWGLVMALGLGGLWVELMQDTVLVPLPACEGEIATAIGRLRGAKLFTGYRGTSATDLDRLATVAAAIGRAALALGPDLAAFEVNPLLVRGNDIEALDALAVWAK
jgi:succinyl-CoA synthetase beta subunit